MKQKFEFAKLYRNNRKAVSRTLRSMWCGEAKNESQQSYVKQLKGIIDGIFAPEYAIPVVQCVNSYESVHTVTDAEANQLVGDLWSESIKPLRFSPFEHQYQCWNTLLTENKSICVTTGTGSGKTECFMLPLVYDLMKQGQTNRVQALFLYPLNALMENQKERLEKLLEAVEALNPGLHLTYAVYNSELVEEEVPVDDPDYEKIQKKINSILGKDEQGNIKFKHCIATRAAMRQTPPNILLTNPTMLEYMLLRKADEDLINPVLKSLRWITIDETHTYTGAGAAELAMLIRRILMAYGVEAEDVRFATSSATIGNGEEDKAKLKEFIANITGLQQHPELVEVIGGNRKGIEGLDKVPDDKPYWDMLIKDEGDCKDGFISLDKLFNDGKTTEEQLEHLDQMCERAEAVGLTDLRVKVHYFYHVPNQGLYIDLNTLGDGSFKIFSENSFDAVNPLLELSRCKKCGEYVAVAEVDYHDSTFKPITFDDSDMFDLEDVDQTDRKLLVFGASNQKIQQGDNNAAYSINGNTFNEVVNQPAGYWDKWHVIANSQCSCPYCGSKLTKQSKNENIEDVADEEDSKKLQKFRISADFVSRLIAPSTLDQMTPPDNASKDALHEGQQYISFVDSRQGAAQASIRQNLEEEMLWVYSTIFHKLCTKKLTKAEIIAKLSLGFRDPSMLPSEIAALSEKITKVSQASDDDPILNQYQDRTLSWHEIFNLLYTDPKCEKYCQQFADRSDGSDEMDKDGKPNADTKEKYVLNIMVQYLSTRPLSAAAPETMGLFMACYPRLENVTRPDDVISFNKMLSPENQIEEEDWKNLLQIFLDFTVRSNQSVYLKMDPHNKFDIFSCVRFATKKEKRRSAHMPVIKDGQVSRHRIIRLVANLIAKDKNITINDAIKGKNYKNAINEVMEAMWTDLLHAGLITRSTHYDDKTHQHENDKDEVIDDVAYPQYRLNLADMSFKLYEDVYLCDTNTIKDTDSHRIERLRPVGLLFKGYSPYLIGGEPQKIKDEYHEKWIDYPYGYKPGGQRASIEDITAWAEKHRSLLWNNKLWGEEGVFADRLETIYQFPNLFVQAEHTAQVDKGVSRQLQKDFKDDHSLNILACSTTMEMGVDLGSLELVMMSSVPPQSANYKQRAGRSGRRGQVRSAAVTLCGSDAIGMRTLRDPLHNIIGKPTACPTVDLQSAQVVQRHVNSFLVRESGVFAQNASDKSQGGNLHQRVLSYYTLYAKEDEGGRTEIYTDASKTVPVTPLDGLGKEDGTSYEKFNEFCADSAKIQACADKITKLIAGTVFDGRVKYVVQEARTANEHCYAKLESRLADLKYAYNQKGISKSRKTSLRIQYKEPLLSNLLVYWATHGFTPNANMPVNVITFDIHSALSNYQKTRPSNPTYPLQTALAQYAPGNPVAMDGVVRIVRGVKYTDFYKDTVAFKTLFRNAQQTVFNKDEIDNHIVWPVSGDTGLELLQPTEFIPDVNESASRILDKNKYTRVNAQLIGAEDWRQNTTEPHLFDARSSRDSGESMILYYNEGIGFGYCHCPQCGRTVLEQWAAATAKNPDALPTEMNPLKPDDDSQPYYHYHLTETNNGKPKPCKNKTNFRRNVVLGDTIPTDFTEIRIRFMHQGWINARSGHVELLTTLGILFTQGLVDELNIERGDVDFAVTQNGHICVFDTNPGGSGYANQLVQMDILNSVVKKAHKSLASGQISTRESLIDRSTLHYINKLDIAGALKWLQEEVNSQKSTPDELKAAFPDAVPSETSLVKLERAFASTKGNVVLFADNNYEVWEYENGDRGWKGQFLSQFIGNPTSTEFCILDNDDKKLPLPFYDVIKNISGWVKDVKHAKNPYLQHGLYPLAYIDGRLYLTNNPDHSSLNEKWGGGTMYMVKADNPEEGSQLFDMTIPNQSNTLIFKLDDDSFNSQDKRTTTDGLGRLVYEKAGGANGVIESFFDYCKAHSDMNVDVIYQDEHLKSILGMCITLQTMNFFMERISNEMNIEFKLEQYYAPNGNALSLKANQPDYATRDAKLNEFVDDWQNDIASAGRDNVKIASVRSAFPKSLPHWRELSFKCGTKKLVIYPDGGLANGWNIDRSNAILDVTTVRYCENIKLFRSDVIKYDVTLEDVL